MRPTSPEVCFRENSERGAVGSRRRGHRPHARVTGCTIVMDKALAIVILLVILAIIGLFSIYQKMDRKRLLAERINIFAGKDYILHQDAFRTGKDFADAVIRAKEAACKTL